MVSVLKNEQDFRACSRTVSTFCVEGVEALKLQLDVLTNGLLKLESEAECVETFTFQIVTTGNFQYEVTTVVIPERLVANRAADDIVRNERIDLRAEQTQAGRCKQNASVGQWTADNGLAAGLCVVSKTPGTS